MYSSAMNILTNDINAIFNNYLLLVVMSLFFIGATYTDIKSLKIYNKFNLAFLITRIIFIFIPNYNLSFGLTHIGGAIIGFLVLTIPAVALMHKMGGDIKFITVLGLYLGTPLTIVLLVLSCVTMLIYSFIKKITTNKEIKKVLVPFAPFFTLSFVIIGIISFYL